MALKIYVVRSLLSPLGSTNNPQMSQTKCGFDGPVVRNLFKKFSEKNKVEGRFGVQGGMRVKVAHCVLEAAPVVFSSRMGMVHQPEGIVNMRSLKLYGLTIQPVRPVGLLLQTEAS